MKYVAYAAAVVFSLFFYGAALAVNTIVSIHPGIVFSIEKKENSWFVTLDDGSFAHIPLDHPVGKTFAEKQVCFPHFTNNGIALVRYADGTADWLPARIAVSIQGEVIVGNIRYSYENSTFEQFAKGADALGGAQPYKTYAYIGSMPVPSGYTFFPDAQFAEHNFALIKKTVQAKAKEQLVDMVYTYSKKVGFELIYVQKTRFSPAYSAQMGIQNNCAWGKKR